MKSLDNNPLKRYWYVVGRSEDLPINKTLPITLFNDWFVLFRDEKENVRAFLDRCIHRNYKLSKGFVHKGQLICPYHGWKYNGSGNVVDIPAEGEDFSSCPHKKAFSYDVREEQGLIYLRPDQNIAGDDVPEPFQMPHYGEKGYETVRLVNIFKNNITNCAENYVDVPHTVFVHKNIFRNGKGDKIKAKVSRNQGKVHVEFLDEKPNHGWFSWFLNRGNHKIIHTDSFVYPNITTVKYLFGPKREFFITSQCSPISDEETYVITDLTYKFGIWNKLARPMVRFQGQSVIDQDLEVLETQMEVIKKYGENFSNSTSDIVHIYIESIRKTMAKGIDPRTLDFKHQEIDIWI